MKIIGSEKIFKLQKIYAQSNDIMREIEKNILITNILDIICPNTVLIIKISYLYFILCLLSVFFINFSDYKIGFRVEFYLDNHNLDIFI